MVVLIDNYDSFSYNLVQLVGAINPAVTVIRNNELTVEEIGQRKPSHIIVSPGPGKPENAGVCESVVTYFTGRIPILGVCLGHQAICEAYGATVSYAKELMHGKMSVVNLAPDCPIFAGLGETAEVARYHSLIAIKETIPDCLQVVAETQDGEVMGVKHKNAPTYGLQFHPESILTPEGEKMIRNFLAMI